MLTDPPSDDFLLLIVSSPSGAGKTTLCNRLRGEFALVLHPLPPAAAAPQDTRILKMLMEHLPLKTAVKLAADITGEPRNALYQLALDMKSAGVADQNSDVSGSPT